MRNKIFRAFSFIAYLAVAAFSTNASAAPVVIDFATGSFGSVGTIEDGGATITGTGITIGLLDVVGSTADSQYNADAELNFTATGGATVNGITTGTTGTIEIVGFISGLVGSSTNPVTLLSGTFNSWSFQNNGIASVFSGSGLDDKDPDLLKALGVPLDTQFEFFGFTLGYDLTSDGVLIADSISTDIINTSVVPVPAAVWLFGSGLIGLVGVARRRA